MTLPLACRTLMQLKTKTLHAKAAIPLTDDAASCLPNFNAVVSWIDSATKTIDSTSPVDVDSLLKLEAGVPWMDDSATPLIKLDTAVPWLDAAASLPKVDAASIPVAGVRTTKVDAASIPVAGFRVKVDPASISVAGIWIKFDPASIPVAGVRNNNKVDTASVQVADVRTKKVDAASLPVAVVRKKIEAAPLVDATAQHGKADAPFISVATNSLLPQLYFNAASHLVATTFPKAEATSQLVAHYLKHEAATPGDAASRFTLDAAIPSMDAAASQTKINAASHLIAATNMNLEAVSLLIASRLSLDAASPMTAASCNNTKKVDARYIPKDATRFDLQGPMINFLPICGECPDND